MINYNFKMIENCIDNIVIYQNNNIMSTIFNHFKIVFYHFCDFWPKIIIIFLANKRPTK